MTPYKPSLTLIRLASQVWDDHKMGSGMKAPHS